MALEITTDFDNWQAIEDALAKGEHVLPADIAQLLRTKSPLPLHVSQYLADAVEGKRKPGRRKEMPFNKLVRQLGPAGNAARAVQDVRRYMDEFRTRQGHARGCLEDAIKQAAKAHGLEPHTVRNLYRRPRKSGK